MLQEKLRDPDHKKTKTLQKRSGIYSELRRHKLPREARTAIKKFSRTRVATRTLTSGIFLRRVSVDIRRRERRKQIEHIDGSTYCLTVPTTPPAIHHNAPGVFRARDEPCERPAQR
jgi:hypothetical protein